MAIAIRSLVGEKTADLACSPVTSLVVHMHEIINGLMPSIVHKARLPSRDI